MHNPLEEVQRRASPAVVCVPASMFVVRTVIVPLMFVVVVVTGVVWFTTPRPLTTSHLRLRLFWNKCRLCLILDLFTYMKQ